MVFETLGLMVHGLGFTVLVQEAPKSEKLLVVPCYAAHEATPPRYSLVILPCYDKMLVWGMLHKKWLLQWSCIAIG